MSRLPETNRLPEKYTQFKLEYVDEYSKNMLEVILAYGDTIQLLKKVQKKSRDIDTSGVTNSRGRLGGKRIEEPIHVGDYESNFLRPDDIDKIKIPALVESNPSMERRELFGIKDSGTALVTISLLWLLETKIVIDEFQDMFWYSGSTYKISNTGTQGTFLDTFSAVTYTIQKV